MSVPPPPPPPPPGGNGVPAAPPAPLSHVKAVSPRPSPTTTTTTNAPPPPPPPPSLGGLTKSPRPSVTSTPVAPAAPTAPVNGNAPPPPPPPPGTGSSVSPRPTKASTTAPSAPSPPPPAPVSTTTPPKKFTSNTPPPPPAAKDPYRVHPRPPPGGGGGAVPPAGRGAVAPSRGSTSASSVVAPAPPPAPPGGASFSPPPPPPPATAATASSSSTTKPVTPSTPAAKPVVAASSSGVPPPRFRRKNPEKVAPEAAYALPPERFLEQMYATQCVGDHTYEPHAYHITIFGRIPAEGRPQIKEVWKKFEPYLSEEEIDRRMNHWVVEIGTCLTKTYANFLDNKLPWFNHVHKVMTLPATQHRGLAIGLEYSVGPLLNCILDEQRFQRFRWELDGPVALDEKQQQVVLLNLMGKNKCDEEVLLAAVQKVASISKTALTLKDSEGNSPLKVAQSLGLKRVAEFIQNEV